MNHTLRRPVLVLAVFLIGPACGGGGGGGGAAGPVPAPPLPATNLPGTTFSALAPVALLPPVHVIDATNVRTDAQVASDLQAVLTPGGSIGSITFTTTASAARTIVLPAQLNVPAFSTVVIDGGGKITLDGGNAVRILLKQFQSTVTVQQLSFVNGFCPPPSSSDTGSGGAINVQDWDGHLTVINCTFTHCRATASGPDIGGGAIRATGQRLFEVSGCTFTNCSGSNGGALDSLGCQLTVIGTTFSTCSATGTGGGADAGPSGQGGIGGAIYIDGVSQNAILPQLVISTCTFANNTASIYGGAIFGYTEPNVVSNAYIDATTFSGNSVTGANGLGGAVYSQNGTLTVANTTFNANQCTDLGGGLWNHTDQGVSITNCTFTANHSSNLGGAISFLSGLMSIVNTTIAGNSADGFAGGVNAGSNAVVANSILSNNTALDAFNGHTTNRTLTDGGGNLQWPNPGGATGLPITPGVTFADPMLQALANNGGPTSTMALPAGSPAINAGVAATTPPLDQRGVTRTSPDSGSCEH